MKKVLLAGFISSTLVLSSFAAAFADDTQTTATQPTAGTTTVTATTTTDATASGTTTTGSAATSTAAPAPSTTAVAPTSTTSAVAPTTTTTVGTTTQVDPSKAGLLSQLKDAIDKALVKDVDPQVVSALRAKHYSYSKIALIAELSKTSGKTVDEVVAILGQHKGIGEIAQLLGIKTTEYKTINKDISQRIIAGIRDFRSTVSQDAQAIKDKIAALKGDVKKDKETKAQAQEAVKAQVVQGIDPTVVNSLRAKGYGYGQIALINAIAQKSGKSIDEVVAAVGQYKGIGEAAKALGVNPQDLKGLRQGVNNDKQGADQQGKQAVQDANTQIKDDQEELNKDKTELKQLQKHEKGAVNQFKRGHGRGQQKQQGSDQEQENDQGQNNEQD